ncbi:hypothetical protein EXIGLDRAFT_451 [Exidia glandulosa HHB12029]|uniref:Uncharacterized protein n=1 Tax=Exidia glandulosa HHB12029 TaxID=1314781 RepID=A0A165QJK9_EXIGL|nr:hypothetical protein EXIGLDRAFT_451 [Exidia glandulosa HHB12029]
MKFLSAKKKENAHAQPTASSSKQPQRPRTPNPVPVKHDHFLAPPRRALEPLSLTPDRNATVRSKKSRSEYTPWRVLIALTLLSRGSVAVAWPVSLLPRVLFPVDAFHRARHCSRRASGSSCTSYTW